MKKIYLDCAASMPIRDSSLKVINESMKEDYANPSALHKLGRNLSKKIEEAREDILESIKGEEHGKVVFTSSATESNNLIIQGLQFQKDDIIFYSSADHASLVGPLEYLRKERGIILKELPLRKGNIEVESFLKNLDQKVKMVVMSHVNNHTGNRQDIANICQTIKSFRPNCHIHLDAVQSYSKYSINLNEILADSLTISSHKIGGPKGIAALFIKSGVEIDPLLIGGGHEAGIRASTLAAPLIFGFLEAIKEAFRSQSQEINHVKELNQLARSILSSDKDITFPFYNDSNSDYILTVLTPGVSTDILVRHLEIEDIYCSTSSACSSKVRSRSKVLEALGLDEKLHKNILRLSFSVFNTKDDVETACNRLLVHYKDLRNISN